jgi:uncharacterized protein YeaO (DUF488 family)
MSIALKRAYEKAESGDGYRVLVDRLWPRGVSREAAAIDEWARDAAPSDSLRKRFHDGSLTWNGFRHLYLAELKGRRDVVRPLAKRARKGKVTLVFSAKNESRNNALVLKQYLEMLDRR